MREIIGFVSLLAFSAVYALEPTPPNLKGPWDWGFFQTQVEYYFSSIEWKAPVTQNDIKLHPEKRISESYDVEFLQSVVVEVERMINIQLKDPKLTQLQKGVIETYRKKALKFKLELNGLRRKVEPQSAVFYDQEETSVFIQVGTTPNFAQMDWEYFQDRVQNKFTSIESRKRTIEKEFENHFEDRIPESLEIEAEINAVVEVEKIIDSESKDERLTQSQKKMVEMYKNKALKLKVELNELMLKVKPRIGIYYEETSPKPEFGPYNWRAFQKRVHGIISSVELRLRIIDQLIREHPGKNAFESLEVEKVLNVIEELENIIQNISDANKLDTVQKLFLE